MRKSKNREERNLLALPFYTDGVDVWADVTKVGEVDNIYMVLIQIGEQTHVHLPSWIIGLN